MGIVLFCLVILIFLMFKLRSDHLFLSDLGDLCIGFLLGFCVCPSTLRYKNNLLYFLSILYIVFMFSTFLYLAFIFV